MHVVPKFPILTSAVAICTMYYANVMQGFASIECTELVENLKKHLREESSHIIEKNCLLLTTIWIVQILRTLGKCTC